MINKLKIKSEFGRNILTLMTGTTLAQAIPIAISPILTRIYAPEDFGVFALYVAVASVMSIAATGRYELAIMLPRKESDAFSIAVLSVVIAAALSVISIIIFLMFNNDIALFLGNPDLGNWLYLMPVSIFLTGLYQALNYWNNRGKQFTKIALSKVSQSAGGGTAQLAVGYGTSLPGGLIAGSVVGQGVGVLTLLRASRKKISAHTSHFSFADLKRNASEYKKFPLFSSWGALLDNAAVQMPVFMITKYFGSSITGLFSFTFKVISMPMTLVSSSVSQIMFQKVTITHNEKPELLFYFVLKMFLLLLVLSIPFVMTLMFWGVEIFSFVFGEQWALAGSFAATLSVAVAIRFAVSPLSSVLALDHNVRKGVAWQVIYFVTLTTALMFFKDQEIETFLVIFVIHEVVLYSLYLIMILGAANTYE
jgi:O-antigen/teichoic acid export membrane protein